MYMELYLYDFDGTIYDGDSSVDFFKFCARKNKKVRKLYFRIIINFLKYKTKYLSITEFKESVFSFLNNFENTEKLVDDFWKTHKNKIKSFYNEKDHQNDVIISASPYFLLKPICDELNVKDLIASDVDITTGHFNSPNNRGEEKVKRLKEKYPNALIKEMYSDSLHDKPLLDIAENSYLVKKDKIYNYLTYKPNVIVRFWNFGWSIYHKNEELWNYLIIGAFTTLVSIGSYALFSKALHIGYLISNILSWIVSVIFAYFTNRWFVFHSENRNILKEFTSFTGSRLLTLLLDTLLMVLFIELLKMDDFIAKILVQVVIVIANYIISKFLVFKK